MHTMLTVVCFFQIPDSDGITVRAWFAILLMNHGGGVQRASYHEHDLNHVKSQLIDIW
jgi:hypothetical protein